MRKSRTINANRYSINSDRLWDTLMQMAKIGATEAGGVSREALTSLDYEARELFRQWCEEAGCTVTVDPVGNMFAHRAGSDSSRAPVAIGSHLDSQPKGGRFDGVYGVMAGLEVIRALNDHDIETDAPVEVINWTNEEGSRFPPVMMGSGTFTGVYSVDETRERSGSDGSTFGEAIDRIDYAGTAPLAEDHPIETFLEVHIEQGPLLEREGNQVGVVTDAQGIAWYDISIQGVAGHAGTVPMEDRMDALVAAADLVSSARRIAIENGPSARITVGGLRVAPGSRNTIPGQVSMQVDMRHPNLNHLDQLATALRTAAHDQELKHGVRLEVTFISQTPPVQFDNTVTDTMRRIATDAGISHMDMLSGAGHDACHIARIAPTGLLFVPCKGGISHNEAESATPEDLAAGCEVIFQVTLARAGAREHG